MKMKKNENKNEIKIKNIMEENKMIKCSTIKYYQKYYSVGLCSCSPDTIINLLFCLIIFFVSNYISKKKKNKGGDSFDKKFSVGMLYSFDRVHVQ